MSKRLKKLSLMLSLSLLAISANAKNEVVNSDKFTAEVAISRTEQNLLEIAGRKIASVIPSVAGALSYYKDDDNGVFYFALANQFHTGTISLFVNDDHGSRYRLILVPTNHPAQEIVLVPTEQAKKKAEDAENTNGSYIYLIKQMMFLMANATNGVDVSDQLSVATHNEEIPLWKEAKLTLVKRYDSEFLVGEEYQITNKTNVLLQLNEQEFYRNNVLAVSVSKLALEPNESAFVYVVRGK